MTERIDNTAVNPDYKPARWFDMKTKIVLATTALLLAMVAWLPFEPGVNKGLAILCFIAILWLTEALHVTVTALLVPVLATALGVFDMTKSLTNFANPTLFLFFGGFALASALAKQGLDRLIAGKLMHLARGKLTVGVFILFGVTAGLSMWISNTATTAMMLPLALGVLSGLDVTQERKTIVFVLLGIAYSASIGGIGTPVGSPPNAIAAAAMSLSFTEWMQFGIPIVVLFLPIGIGLLYALLRPNLNHTITTSDVTIDWHRGRLSIAGIFVVTAVLWIISQPLSQALGGVAQLDTLIALGAVVAIIVSRCASWEDLNRGTEWGVLLLFGGGLTLSALLAETGTSKFLSQHISLLLTDASPFVILLVLAFFVVFLTELVSNTAAAALLIPLFMVVAEALQLSPLVVSVLIAIAASCAFMLPVATPPNAMVFASGHIQQREMMQAGVVLNIAFAVLLAGIAYFVGDIFH